jgi:rubrerythrin
MARYFPVPANPAYNDGTMGKKFSTTDLSKISDDKALAIAAFGESVAAYRCIILSEKARDRKLRDSFEAMAREERQQRDRVQDLLHRLSPAAAFYLSQEDKLTVCVGPRLVDARDDARFDEAMKLVIASEKRSASFYTRYAVHAQDAGVKSLFIASAKSGLDQVQRLRTLLNEAGKQIAEPCPVSQLRMA